MRPGNEAGNGCLHRTDVGGIHERTFRSGGEEEGEGEARAEGREHQGHSWRLPDQGWASESHPDRRDRLQGRGSLRSRHTSTLIALSPSEGCRAL